MKIAIFTAKKILLNILQNKAVAFNFNPFGGLSDAELERAIVPKFDLSILAKLVLNDEPKIIEFIGKKGRGKTTHLKLLHQQLSNYPLFLLNSQSDFTEVFESQSNIVFIDSIHHFNIFQRIKLFKAKETIVLTTHWGRFLETKLAGKSHFRYDFKGIDAADLKTILENRIKIAARGESETFKIKEEEIADLIEKYGDDYRGIINHLYDEFQQNQMI